MIEPVLVNLEDRSGESGLRQFLNGEADGCSGAREPAIGYRLAHARASLWGKQFGRRTIVERTGHASRTPSRRSRENTGSRSTPRRTQASFRFEPPSLARKGSKTKLLMNEHLSLGSGRGATTAAHRAPILP